MDRDLKREYMARGSTLATIVVVHASIIFALVTHMLTVHSGNIPEAILVTVVDKPLRPPEDLSYPRLKWNRWIPVILPESMPHVSVPVYQEPAPILEGSSSAQTAPNAPSTVVNPSYIGLKTSGGDSNLEGGKHSIPVIQICAANLSRRFGTGARAGICDRAGAGRQAGARKKVEVVRAVDSADSMKPRWTPSVRWKFAPPAGPMTKFKQRLKWSSNFRPRIFQAYPWSSCRLIPQWRGK